MKGLPYNISSTTKEEPSDNKETAEHQRNRKRRRGNLGVLHVLQQVADDVSEGTNKESTELLKQRTQTCHSCPETHTHTHIRSQKFKIQAKRPTFRFIFPPLWGEPEGNATHSRVGRLDGESSLLRMMSPHLSTNRVEETGSPR